MGERRNARELALQALFFLDVINEEPQALFDLFCDHFHEMIDEKVAAPQKAFFVQLVNGVIMSFDETDRLIKMSSQNWKISRMPIVDRNIMRIAVYELMQCQDIPPSVTINEAVDIGKRYGTRGSAAFINGVLDRIRASQYLEKVPEVKS